MIAKLLVWILYRIHVQGREHVPKDGGAVIVSNHVTYLDVVFLTIATGRRIRFIASDTLHKTNRFRWLLKISFIELIPPAKTRSFFEKNLEHFKNIIELCNNHKIVLIHVITANGYKDIFYKEGFSEYMEEILKELGQKNIIKLKDIYHSNPEIYPYISKSGYDWVHYSSKAAQLIVEQISNYLNKLEAS